MSLERLAAELVEYSPLADMPGETLDKDIMPYIIQGFQLSDTSESLLEDVKEEVRLKGLMLGRGEESKLVGRVGRIESEVKKIYDACRSISGERAVPFWLALSVVRYFNTELYSNHSDFLNEALGDISNSIMDTNYRAGQCDYRILSRSSQGRNNPRRFRRKAIDHLDTSRNIWIDCRENHHQVAYRHARAAHINLYLYRLTQDSDRLKEARELIGVALSHINHNTKLKDIHDILRIEGRILDVKT